MINELIIGRIIVQPVSSLSWLGSTKQVINIFLETICAICDFVTFTSSPYQYMSYKTYF